MYIYELSRTRGGIREVVGVREDLQRQGKGQASNIYTLQISQSVVEYGLSVLLEVTGDDSNHAEILDECFELIL